MVQVSGSQPMHWAGNGSFETTHSPGVVGSCVATRPLKLAVYVCPKSVALAPSQRDDVLEADDSGSTIGKGGGSAGGDGGALGGGIIGGYRHRHMQR